MKPIRSAVVTGATGHVGNALVRALLGRGIPVTALTQPGSDLTPLLGLAVEKAIGDVTDGASLTEAFQGADVVFHLAGLVSITAGREAVLAKVNVEGTRNVVDACRAAGVRRLVYMSSVHALTEPPPKGVLDETRGFDPATAFGPYGKSKAAASKLVQDAARGGSLDAVLVLPTGCLGPYDYRLSEVGQLVSMAGRGTIPIVIDGGYDWVDVRDVALGTLAAAERAPTGEAYLLSSAYLPATALCEAVAKVSGARPPLVALPLWLARGLSYGGYAWERVTGRRALLTPYAVHTVGKDFDISIEKARRELGFAPRPVEESLADAWRWLSTDPLSPLQRGTRVAPGRLPSPG
jgi:dihydroflavonol-4-reductase